MKMKKSFLTTGLILFLSSFLMAQSNHTISIDGSNNGWAAVETFTNISPNGNAYFTWDADYIYFAISHSQADYGNMATFMYFDTDPIGTNGTTNAYAWGEYITTPFGADYVVVWKNQSNADYIEVMQWNGSSWDQVAFSTSTSLIVDGNTIVEFAIGTDYREVKVKRSYIGDPDAIKFCTFTEQQWDSYWRYFAWPNDEWTDGGRASGQSIPNYYGFILVAGISQTNAPYYNASFDGFTGSGTDWATGSNWTKGSVPTTSDLTIIPTGKNVEIGTSTQANTYDLLNKGTLFIRSSSSGTGSLIHNTSGVSAIVERYVAGDWSTWDAGWHLISSPVASQAMSAFETTGAGNDYDLYAWNEASNLWMNYKDPGFSSWHGGTYFSVGRGYLISYEQTQTGKAFNGDLNVSDVSLSNLSYTTGQGNGWHLLGNPFASALEWNNGTWSLTNVAGTAKIWNSGSKSYTDIAPNGIIPQAQGFFVQVYNSSNSLTIPAAARTHSSTAWYKASDVPMLKLIARPTDGSSAQETLIRIEPEATPGNDPYWDSRFLAGYAPQIYSLADGVKLSTNALPAIEENTEIPLGFEKNDHSSFSIELAENTLAAIVLLKDLKLGITHNLTQQPVYTFTSAEGDNANRFKLAFASVGISPEQQNPVPYAWYANGMLHFRNVESGSLVEVYSSHGHKVVSERLQGNTLSLQVAPGVYMLKISGAQQQNVQKVVIY
ncbi:MAG: hypothetical protein PWP35_46 [Bacteroidales bacterium]|nr:hypothetical protein [Bacteroidales bacterium]